MSNPTSKIVIDETEKPSRLQKVGAFVKRNRLVLATTASAMAGITTGYYLRDRSTTILDEANEALESVQDKIEKMEEDLANTDQS